MTVDQIVKSIAESLRAGCIDLAVNTLRNTAQLSPEAGYSYDWHADFHDALDSYIGRPMSQALWDAMVDERSRSRNREGEHN